MTTPTRPRVDEATMIELESRVEKFRLMELPGQPMGMHIGTSNLVDDLLENLKRIRDDKDALLERIVWLGNALMRIEAAARCLERGEEQPQECAQDIQRMVHNAITGKELFRWSHAPRDLSMEITSSPPTAGDIVTLPFEVLAEELRRRGATVEPARHGGDYDDGGRAA